MDTSSKITRIAILRETNSKRNKGSVMKWAYDLLGCDYISQTELIKSKNGWVSTFSYLGGTSPNLKHGLLILYGVDI